MDDSHCLDRDDLFVTSGQRARTSARDRPASVKLSELTFHTCTCSCLPICPPWQTLLKLLAPTSCPSRYPDSDRERYRKCRCWLHTRCSALSIADVLPKPCVPNSSREQNAVLCCNRESDVAQYWDVRVRDKSTHVAPSSRRFSFCSASTLYRKNS